MKRNDISRRVMPLAILLAAILCHAMPSRALAAAAAPAPLPRAIAYAMWDDDFLYLAARVDDVNLIATNNTAMSEPWRDDSVEFYFDVSGLPANAVHPGCARISVSAASGFTCLIGTSAGTWKAQPQWLMGLKVAVEREGTLNRPDDTDVGYTVELGLPWKFLGGAPEPEHRVGFNFVANVRGENETLVSWSSRAQSREDLDRPLSWGSLELSAGLKPAVADNDVLICPRAYAPPLVDGRLGAAEWIGASVIQLQKPAPETAPAPPAPGAPGARLLATYRYDYQPFAPPAAGKGGTLTSLADQPPDGVGPWFSADSTAWHKAMLRQAREAAIDVILPIYRGDPEARHTWSRLGLLRLVEALKETKDGRLSYPLVAMYLDASCLPQAGAADLTSAAGRQALWSMIAEFCAIVPEEFRAQFDIGAGARSNLVVLGPPTGVENWDPAVMDFCRDNYRRTYGARLIVLGDEGWRSKAPNLDGYCSLAPGIAMSYGKEGPRATARPASSAAVAVASGDLATVRLSPGYLGPGAIVPRHGGQGYEQSWMRAVGVAPDFVIVDSLNDFAAASEIASSRQHGVRFLDITRQSAQALAGRSQYRIALRRETLPQVLEPGVTYQVELLVENQGFEDLAESNNVEISYTLKNRSRPDLKRTGVATPRLLVLAGQRAPLVVEMSTSTIEGRLPVGDYDLTFDVTKSALPILRSKWLLKHLFEVSLPVRLDRVPAERPTVLGTTLPSAMAAGARRRVRVRLRNDGSRAWSAKTTALAYHWVRVPGPGASAAAAPQTVEFEGVRTGLPKNVAPGEMISMYAWVEAKKADGSPLPAWTPDAEWLYQLQWDLVEGQDRWFSRLGAEPYAESVAVLSSDLGGRVVSADLPESLEAGKSYPVKILLRNDGSTTWDKDRVRVTYHWYFWDGAEASWPGAVTPLLEPVSPGASALLTAQVAAPPCAGSYRLAWDLMADDRYASQILDAASRDLFVQPVNVTGGAFEPLDLSQLCNVFASTHDGYRNRGAFDAGGLSFPAEFVPPDSVPVGDRVRLPEFYPAVYYGAPGSAPAGAEAARVPLRYPPMDQRGGLAVACDGQQIALPPGPVQAIYIAASSSEPMEAEFRLAYADGASESKVLTIPSWTQPPPKVLAAARAPFVRSALDDVQKPASIYLLAIGGFSRQAAPTALVLPSALQVKVFAITLQRPAAETTGGS